MRENVGGVLVGCSVRVLVTIPHDEHPIFEFGLFDDGTEQD